MPTNYSRNPTETVGPSSASVTRAETLARTVNETPLADNPNAVVDARPVYLIEEAV